jgi:hypothetical protein
MVILEASKVLCDAIASGVPNIDAEGEVGLAITRKAARLELFLSEISRYRWLTSSSASHASCMMALAAIPARRPAACADEVIIRGNQSRPPTTSDQITTSRLESFASERCLSSGAIRPDLRGRKYIWTAEGV